MYFGKVRQTFAQSNKLNTSVAEFVNRYHRNLFTEQDVHGFMKDSVARIEKLNQEHPRCSPVIATWDNYNKKDWRLSFGGKSIIEYTLFKADRHYGK